MSARIEYHVIKTGFTTVDMLHAAGLGIVLAIASNGPVDLSDAGWFYRLYCTNDLHFQLQDDVLDRLFTLPNIDEVIAIAQHGENISLPIAQLDGFLAALFTMRGPRVVSVMDMLARQQIEEGLVKAQNAITRWLTYIHRETQSVENGLHSFLAEYQADATIHPQIAFKHKGDIAIPMPIDPACSYAMRRLLSDGLVTDKTNVTLRQPRFGRVLVFIGAARLLRAQRIGGKLINIYVPLAKSLGLTPDTALPILKPINIPADQALALQWITYYRQQTILNAEWSALSYQTLQTQGVQQPISRDRGCLDIVWLAILSQRAGESVINHWYSLLSSQRNNLSFDMQYVIDMLLQRRIDSLMTHLSDIARSLAHDPTKQNRRYSVQEVKEIMGMMLKEESHPLCAIFGHETGTYRFGCALRLLGRVNPSALRDLIDQLNAVGSDDTLIRILSKALQECAVAEARSPFIIVPNDNDFNLLLDDVWRYSAQTIAGILIILSALRYSPKEGAQFESPEETSRIDIQIVNQTQHQHPIPSRSVPIRPEGQSR